MTNPIGPLRSTELEAVVDLVANGALSPMPTSSTPPGGPRRVVHVLTEAAAIGGLTRLVERWIARDDKSVAMVVVTRQAEVVEALAAAARSSGGTAVALGPDGPDSIERAVTLRRLVQEGDVVICHLHSDDVVAAAAFGSGYSGPPVAIYNHADHLFWLSPTQATAIVDAREAGLSITRKVRGYPEDRSFLLPLPVPRVENHKNGRVRTRLGIADHEVVAITVARGIKFQDTRLFPRFSTLIERLLDENPQLLYCAVGPEPAAEPWPALRAKYGRRVIVTGPVSDPQQFLGGADIYLDTFPFSSTTSLLEAAATFLPTVTLDAHMGLRTVLGLADFLPDAANRPSNVAAYIERVKALVGSPTLRSLSGKAAREGYLRLTDEAPWREALRVLYSRIDLAHHDGLAIGDVPAPSVTEAVIEYSLTLMAIEQNVPLLWSVSGSLPRFDGPDRRRLKARVLGSRAARRLGTELHVAPWKADRLLLPPVVPTRGWTQRDRRP